jgi:hypothetical protein
MQNINILYASNVGGTGPVLEIIAIASSLVEKKKNFKIQIFLIDSSPFFFKKIIKKISRKIFFLIKKKKLENKNISFENTLLFEKSIYLKNKNYSIEIKKFPQSFSFICFIISLGKSIKYWVKINFKKNKYNFFLKFKYKKIHIGDLVASTYLRIYPRHSGRLKLDFSLFRIFFKCIYMSEISKNFNKRNFLDFFFITNEPTYLENFWKRKFLSLGVKIVETNTYDGKLKIIDNKKKYVSPWILPKKIKEDFTKNEIFKIKDYFFKRFSKAHTVLEYLREDGSNNNKKNKLADHQNSEIKIINNKKYAVVYLHTFEDAQYCFGINDFKDIYDWTEYTISACLENKNFFRVFIKPHPTVNDYYQADKIAYKNIINKFYQNQRVTFLEPKTSIFNLADRSKFTHFVHHGSVAIELAYLKQNVIGYVGGPWTTNYKFLRTWKTKKQYKSIIDNSHNFTSKISKNFFRDLYSYATEAFINSKPLKRRSVRLLMIKKYPKFKHEIKGSRKWTKCIKEIRPQSKMLNDILNLVFWKYSVINKIQNKAHN